MGLLGRPMPRMLALVGEQVEGAGRVLEIASGTGRVTAAIAPRVGELLATDYAEAMVDATRARVAGLSNVRCERRDLYALGEPPGSFDAVVAANVLHLVPDLPGALAALHRVLAPGGTLVVPTFCHAQDGVSKAVSFALSWVSFPSRRRFDARALLAEVERAGFRVERTELIPGLLPIGFLSARRLPDA
jgi:ubiquinone/menaquinone biosynthesis C-methylase UbiE